MPVIARMAKVKAQLCEGDEFVMKVQAPGDVRMTSTTSVLTFDDLLAGIKPGSFKEVDWGKRRGKEVW